MGEVSAVIASTKSKATLRVSLEGTGPTNPQMPVELQELDAIKTEIGDALALMGQIRQRLELAFSGLSSQEL